MEKYTLKKKLVSSDMRLLEDLDLTQRQMKRPCCGRRRVKSHTRLETEEDTEVSRIWKPRSTQVFPIMKTTVMFDDCI